MKTNRYRLQWAKPLRKVHISNTNNNGSNTDYDPQEIRLHCRIVNKICQKLSSEKFINCDVKAKILKQARMTETRLYEHTRLSTPSTLLFVA